MGRERRRARLPVTLAEVALPDVFTGFGSIPYLTEMYGTSARHIVEAAKKVM